jgi:hypothetical protein
MKKSIRRMFFRPFGLQGLIGAVPVFMGDVVGAMLDEPAWIAHAHGFIAHEHKSVGDAERKLVEREVLLAHEAPEVKLSRRELAHERAALGDERP